MKKTKICVIGSYSGRNAGDAAILENLCRDISSVYNNVEFLVPTINKRFINRNYNQFCVKAIPMMPWNLSLKIFGVPIFRAALQSDLILLTDAILFDHKMWNPVFNFLSTMTMVLPFAKKRGIPVVLYNASIGPIKSNLGKWCLQKVLDCTNLLIVRDKESIDVLERLDTHHDDIILAADCALNTLLPNSDRMSEIKKREGIFNDDHPYLSINLNDYLDVFVKESGKSIGRERFAQIIAEVVDRVVEEIGVKIIFVVTQAMDIRIVNEVIAKMKRSASVKVVSNKTYSHNDLAAIFAEVDMHVGMRTHSLILATASCTPSISIVYRPKNRGYMKTIEQSSRSIELDEFFDAESLYNLIYKTWQERENVKKDLIPIIEREKKKARMSAELLEKYIGTA
jgi:polysaccharide pyruvyl transferase WcaK-like protein